MVHKPGPRNFSLDGNSAMLRYLPYSGGPSDSSWSTPSTSAKGSRFMHMTKMVNASMELSWTGTAITLVGERMNGSYSVTLDGNVSQHTLTSNALLSGSTPDIVTLFSAKDLQDTPHNLTLSVREGEIAVHSANVTINIKEEFKVAKIPVATNAIPPAANQFFFSHGFNWSVADFRGTPSLGIDVEDAQLSFDLNSTRAFEIYGRTGPAQGSFKVEVLQNSTASCSDSFTGNASSPDTDSIALLYVATNMDPTMNYRVNINNNEGKFDLDHLVIYETVPG
ncbi:hypothetical protein WOLCODRAFT_18727 [Wolfiporia cocos MD-104 SS10]|uniref:Uncharacterized protein n=1 Tax=Wolfiporia cocos (strain MD-104) TaxID=742152 RepID=A0A2H3JVS9_WOLCO|nr:hypothetical protein WOLCODRAFT_18727 [Wolfiporia cocos MD-104 SS10]